MHRVEVDSTPIRSIGYDPKTCVLEVEWRTGRVYQYFAVPEALHAWLMRVADKQGIMERMVKGHFDYAEVTKCEEPEALDLVDALARSLENLDSRRRDDRTNDKD